MDPWQPFVAFQAQPWLALFPALLFAALGALSRRRLILSTALLWLLYAGYEFGMKTRLLCSGECNIRVDLLLLGPLLIGLSAVALLALAFRRGRRSGD